MSLGLSHVRRPLMLKRLLDWIIPDHALRVDESQSWGMSDEWWAEQIPQQAFTPATVTRPRAEGKTTTTLGAVPCTCSPRHDPPDYTDPNCWACNRA